MRRRAVHFALISLVPILQGEIANAGDAAAPSAMTLPEALQYARAHHPALRAALARAQAVAADATVTRARWYPTLVGTAQLLASTTNNTTGSYLSIPGFDNPRVSATRAESPGSASLAPSPSTLVGLGARQELFDFGRITAQVAVDDLNAEAERLSSESTSLVIDYDVEETYFAVSTAHAIQTASEHAYERAAVHRDLARAGVESGLRRPIELTRSEATLDRYDLGRIRARRGVAVAESVFAAAVGLPGSRLDITPAAEAPTEVPPLPAALAKALRDNPELLGAHAREQGQEARVRAIESETRPNLFLSGAISGNAGGATPSSGEAAPDQGLLPVVPNWDVGVALSWPLLDPTVSARADRARIQQDAEREETRAVQLRVTASVEEAYLDVEAAGEALPVLKHTMDAAVANYAQANARFENGLGDTVELADAEELRTNAEIELALGTFEVARTRAALGRLIAEHP
jgi:outer membrane protein